MKWHNLTSKQIRILYDISYVFEQLFASNSTSTDNLTPLIAKFFDSTPGFYIGPNNKENRNEAKKYLGYCLFQQANKTNRCYWFIKHLRNSFAHARIIRDSKQYFVDIKLGKRQFLCHFSREMFEQLLNCIENQTNEIKKVN